MLKNLKVDNSISKYVRDKRLYQSTKSDNEIISILQSIGEYNELIFLTAFRISGLLAPIYNCLFNINIPNILIVDPGEKISNNLFSKYSEFLSVFICPSNNQTKLTKSEIENILRNDNDPDITKKIADTIESINQTLNQCYINNKTTWKKVLADNTITVISLPKNNKDNKDTENTNNSRKILDMLLASLYMYQRNFCNHNLKIFIDEIEHQNLELKGPINTILTKGINYNLGLNFASETIPDKIISKSKRRNNISLSVYFKPHEASKKAVIDILDLDKDKQELMDQFGPGDCFVNGNIYNFRTKAKENALIWGEVIKRGANEESENKDLE